eukprot:scaffold2527_cov185-Skeletonema_menzelii.AAC.16
MASADTKAISKRQRRAQGSNPSTTWQQQPRIKSAASRARAYINYAGLNDDDDDNNDDGKRTTDKKKKGKTTKKVEDMLDPKLDLNSPEVKFGRMLGGTEQRVRHKAVKMLRHYLKQRADIATGAGISELDLLKLWKAMWYTLYMADKVPVQEKLSQILADLMWCLAGTEEDDETAGQMYMQITEQGNGFYEDEDGDVMWTEVLDDDDEDEEGEDEEEDEENAWQDMPSDDDEEGNEVEGMDESEDDEVDEEGERIAIMNEAHCRGAHLVSLYVATFLRTVKREWGNVDKHRVDKFYTVVRLMIRESYKYMAVRHWNLGIIRLFNDVIYDEALSHESEGLTNGLRFHLIDICIEELAQVNAQAEIPLTEATFLDCVEPFFALAQKAKDKNVHKRVMEKVLLKFLTEYSFVATLPDQEEEDGDEDTSLIFSQVHVGSVAKFIFEIASDPESDERFRKALYEMYKTYERQIRAAGRDVDLSHIEEGDSEEDCCATNTCAHHMGAAEEDDETGEMEADATEPETPVETKSDKKKKKKSKKKSKELDETETLQEDDKNAEVSTPKTSSKKKKKKDTGGKENVTSEDITAQYDGSATKKSSKKRKDNDESTPTTKKKQRSSSPSVDPHSMPSPDQVISPTSSDADDAPTGGSRRVSFGKMNHCKSYKASMKAIKTLNKERWDTTTRTPEKGILNKTPSTSKSSSKASSKKASSKKKKSKK